MRRAEDKSDRFSLDEKNFLASRYFLNHDVSLAMGAIPFFR